MVKKYDSFSSKFFMSTYVFLIPACKSIFTVGNIYCHSAVILVIQKTIYVVKIKYGSGFSIFLVDRKKI